MRAGFGLYYVPTSRGITYNRFEKGNANLLVEQGVTVDRAIAVVALESLNGTTGRDVTALVGPLNLIQGLVGMFSNQSWFPKPLLMNTPLPQVTFDPQTGVAEQHRQRQRKAHQPHGGAPVRGGSAAGGGQRAGTNRSKPSTVWRAKPGGGCDSDAPGAASCGDT